jgi:ankyrin repeat protein
MFRRLSLVLALLIPATLLADPPRSAENAEARGAKSTTQVQLEEYFFDAARRGDRDMLKEFVDAGYDLNTRTEKGYTAMILAAYHGHAEAIELLIAASADPCAKDRRGNTALMGAIFKGEFAIARRLIDANCQPDQRNNAGQTAAMYAALFGRTELLKALTDKGASLHTRDAMGNTPQTLSSTVPLGAMSSKDGPAAARDQRE